MSTAMNKDLLDKYRYINVDYDNWSDSTQDDFKTQMHTKGVEVDQIYFSGFWSQGDGACFTGEVEDFTKLMTHYNLTPEYPMITKLLEMEGRVQCSVYHHDRYYHDNSVSFSWAVDKFEDCININSLFIELVVERFDTLLDAEYDKFMSDVESNLKAEMRQLYKDLEREYDALTTDEAVWDTIVANDLHKETEHE